MIQFPSRKETEILIRVPLGGTDTSEFANICDLEGNDMWHRLDNLEQKGYVMGMITEEKATQWQLTHMGVRMVKFIKQHLNSNE